ncbi:protein phosphatase 1 regulatory subunit 12A [Polypterus senegalus]|uniref:protein phosphatase 1 regulatory subunit 12A n=1 Tax=Polypterus senegalus TaxID=55291 RepID=UPI001965B6F6|nr:protein phosphatase 1 regulatory subunit 12A [Polypterus senegalus]
MAAEDRSRSDAARQKRREQLSRWMGSETDQSGTTPRVRATGSTRGRVCFAQGAVFMAACSAGDREEVRELLQQGAEINHTNVDGLTALHQACIDENLEMVEFLVEHGANVNQPDNEGWTPLHAAASCGFVEIAQYLIKQGAWVAAVNSEGELPLDVTQEEPMEKLLQAEIKNQGVDIEAARQEEERIMIQDAQQWVNQGRVEISRHPKTGATALHVAAAKGYIEVMKLLLKAGFKVNLTDNDGWTPLHAAAHWGQEEACRLLVESFCDMNVVNKVGQTSFDVADENLVDILEELQKKQKDLRLEKERQDKLQAPLIETSPVSQNAPSRTRRSSISRMSSKEKISLHDKERKALETLDTVAFERVNDEEEEARREAESSSSSSEAESESESEEEPDKKVKTREMINNLNNKLNSSSISNATTVSSSINKKPLNLLGKPPLAVRSTEEEKKELSVLPTSWRTSLRKTGSYGTLNSTIAGSNQEESQAKVTSVGGVIRSASSPRLTGLEAEAKDRDNKEPRLARVPPTPTRRLFSIPDSSQEPPSSPLARSSSFPRHLTSDSSSEPSSVLPRRINSQGGNEITDLPSTFQRRWTREQSEDKSIPSTASTTTTSSVTTTTSVSNEFKERRRSYLTPVRDEEAEALRKAKSRHARQSRRSTQGVTLTDLQEAEKTIKSEQESREQERKKKEQEEKERAEAVAKSRSGRAGDEGEVSWRSRIANLQKSDLLGLTTPGDSNHLLRSETLESRDREKETEDKLGQRGTNLRERRRPRGKRRITGPPGTGGGQESDDNEDSVEEGGGDRAGQDSQTQADRLNSRGDSVSNDRLVSRGFSSRGGSAHMFSEPNGERRDYKKLYEDINRENGQLQSQLQETQRLISQTRTDLDKATQRQERIADRSALLEMEKKERRLLERRIQDLEEQLKVLADLKADNQRLKDENGALIRVISKLSK